jgi:protein-tyrosine phosphatase
VNILVVCHANVCRSPMAECVFRHAIESACGKDAITVESAGIEADIGRKMHPLSERALIERGYVAAETSARLLLGVGLASVDVVLVMEKRQQIRLTTRFPWATGRIWRMGHWINEDITDPINGDQTTFRGTLDVIENAVQSWLPALGAKRS